MKTNTKINLIGWTAFILAVAVIARMAYELASMINY